MDDIMFLTFFWNSSKELAEVLEEVREAAMGSIGRYGLLQNPHI